MLRRPVACKELAINYVTNASCTKASFAFTSKLQVKPSNSRHKKFKNYPSSFAILWSAANTMERARGHFPVPTWTKRFWLPFRLKIVCAYIFNHRMSKSSRTHIYTCTQRTTLTCECRSGGLLLTAGTHSTVAVWLNKSRLQHGKQIVLWVSDLSAALPKCQLAEKEISLFLMKHAVLACLVHALGSKCNWTPFICTVPSAVLLPPLPPPHALNNCISCFPSSFMYSLSVGK